MRMSPWRGWERTLPFTSRASRWHTEGGGMRPVMSSRSTYPLTSSEFGLCEARLRLGPCVAGHHTARSIQPINQTQLNTPSRVSSMPSLAFDQ